MARLSLLSVVVCDGFATALVTWSAGMIFGVLTSGIIPGTDMLKVPMPIISAWLLSLCVFWPVRALELTRSKSFAMALEA